MHSRPILLLAALALAACKPTPSAPEAENPSEASQGEAAAESEGLEADGERGQEATWDAVLEGDLTADETERLAAARSARSQLGQTLLQTVVAATADGFPSAVRVCHDDAPRLAAEASSPGVRLGRTSHRLRNPENAPPSWAAAHVERGESTPALFRGPDGQIAELTPIATAPACLNCHGAAESYSAELQATLAALYPADEATGFAEGELRGWFWLTAD